jgi:hypothetical protein
MKTNMVEIRFDMKSITARVGNVPEWAVNWEQIERIGYRTTEEGPLQDDYFLVLRTKDVPPLYYDISLAWKGALELSAYINQLPDSKIPPNGILANCTTVASITIWPSDKSGGPLE